MQKFKSVLEVSKNAPFVYDKLRGLFAVYKPAGEHVEQVRQTLKVHLCRDLNALEVRPPDDYVEIEGPTTGPMTISVRPSYADDTLLTGPRYQPEDVRISFGNKLYPFSSGILICSVNSNWMVRQLQESQPLKFYKVKGILGKATSDYSIKGKVVEKTTYKHIRRDHMDMVCAAIQSSHQKNMFKACGLPIQSQAAYELAVQGPIRPASNRVPMMYALKCIDFTPPEFTLEIVCVNEDEMFLKDIVHTIGLQARSTAACSQIQCFRFGLFSVESALLKKHWTLEHIADNVAFFKNLLHENKFLVEPIDPILREHSTMKQIESTTNPLITA